MSAGPCGCALGDDGAAMSGRQFSREMIGAVALTGNGSSSGEPSMSSRACLEIASGRIFLYLAIQACQRGG